MNVENVLINLCVEFSEDVLTVSTKRNPGLVAMVDSFEPRPIGLGAVRRSIRGVE